MTFPRSNIFILYSNILLQNPTLYDDSHLKQQLIKNFLFLANIYVLENNTLCSLHH